MTDETRTVTRDQMRQALIESDLIPRYREYSLLSPSMNPAETVEHLATVWGDAIFAALPAAATGEGLSAPLNVERLADALYGVGFIMDRRPVMREDMDRLVAEYARLAATPPVGEER